MVDSPHNLQSTVGSDGFILMLILIVIMGGFLTVDKHVSNLDDILELNARLLSQTKFEATLQPEITHHLKVLFAATVRSGNSSKRMPSPRPSTLSQCNSLPSLTQHSPSLKLTAT